MARGTEVVNHAAYVGHQEEVGVYQFFSAGKEQTRDDAVAERLAGKFHFGKVGAAADAGGEFPRVVVAKPAFVDEDRVGTIQKIFKAGVDCGGETRFHSKRSPAGLIKMDETIRRIRGSGIAGENPDVAILLDGRKRAHAVRWNFGIGAEGRH